MGTASILVNNLKDSSWHDINEGFHEDFRIVVSVSKNFITKIVYGLKVFAIAVLISLSIPNTLYWIQVRGARRMT